MSNKMGTVECIFESESKKTLIYVSDTPGRLKFLGIMSTAIRILLLTVVED